MEVETDAGELFDITIDKNFFGLTQLYPTKTDDITADIVAVTTLSAHAFESWRGKGDLGRMWLRDFLSVGLPNCRTMTYGYYSRLCSPGVHQIRDYSRGSLEELKKARMSEEVVGFCFNVSSRYFTIKDISSGPHMKGKGQLFL
ncbi:uncharacterized protein LAJ45_06918 [Morchella importuna]|uniref:uncharacterized protein n=1 Tax=Morchella importuna TaxID=1174673 RepID=UPI001E8CE98D|nr:uncharacterized protein LAJ45_06918 [Morchella importuna]KAH8148944.1 hypothetical protein LAJ45_06918 [Morchella importuna]